MSMVQEKPSMDMNPKFRLSTYFLPKRAQFFSIALIGAPVSAAAILGARMVEMHIHEVYP